MTSRKKKKQRSSQPRETAPRRRQRSVSVPLLLGTAIVLAVLAVSSYFWHRYQVGRLAPELLEQARALEAEGNLLEATQWIYQYLQIRPDDAEARIYLASTYDATATDVNRQLQAIELYRDALLTASAAERPDLNRRLAARLLEVALFQMQALDTDVEGVRAQVLSRLLAATRVATEVIEHDDQDPEGWRILAASLLARHRLQPLDELPTFVDSIGSAFEQAVQHNPADVPLAIQWANLLRNQVDLLDAAQQDLTEPERAELADAAVDRAVANNSDDAQTYLARAGYRSAYRLDGVPDDLDRAEQLAPDSATVQLALSVDAQRRSAGAMAEGNVLEANHQREQAVQYLEKAIELEPGDVRAYLMLGQLHRRQGQSDAAIAVLEQGLEQAGQQNLQLNALLPELLLDRSDPERDEASWKRIAGHIDRYDEAVRRMRPLLTDIARRDLEQVGDLLRARLLVQQGEFQAAINVLEQLLVDPAAVERTRQIVAWQLREQAHRQLGQTESAARAAEQLARLQPDQVLPLIIAARNWLAAERPDQAVGQLQRALAVQESLEIRFLLAAASLDHQRQQPPDQQDWRLFQENLSHLRQADASRPIPNPWRMALLQASYEQAMGTDQTIAQSLQRLRKAELQYPESAALLRQLAELYGRLDAEADAERALVKLSFVTAMQADNWAEAQPWEERLQVRRDDPQVFWQYYSGRRLIAQAASSQDPALDAAATLLDELDAAHPDNPNRHLLRAVLCARRRDLPAAVDAYRTALDSGAPNEFAYEQLVLLLAQLGRQEEAEAALAEFRQRLPNSRVLPNLAILLQRRVGDRQAALELAQQEIENNPTDPQLRVRLGRMLEELEQPDEAQRAYEEALVLDPANRSAMSALIGQYTRTERQAEAKSLLEKLVADPELDNTQRIMVRATGLELLGDPVAGVDVLRQAISSPPKTPDDRTTNDQRDSADNLRRALAEMLVRQETDETLEEAEDLVRDIVQRRPEAADAQRTLAGILLLKGGGANRRQALEIFEKLAADPQRLGQADTIALARLRESEADWQGATQALQAMAADRDMTPRELRELIRGLLQQGSTDEAGQRIAQLERIEPAEPPTVQLKIRWLRDMQRSDEIAALLEDFEQQLLARAGNDPQSQLQAREVIGILYTSVDMHQQAAERYQQVKAAEPKAYGNLARSLAQQGRLDEAIQLCLDAARNDDGIAPAMTMHVALLTSQPEPEHWEKAEPLFRRTLEAHGEDPLFLSALATVRLVQRRHEEAVKLYRRLLEAQPKNVAAWNNLALALGEEPQTVDEALEAIDRALDLGGKQPTFLDTKATILLKQGEYQEAVTLLEQAVDGALRNPAYQQTLPIHQLHLAVAYIRSNRHDEAQKVYQEALTNNVQNSALLTQTDLAMLEELREKYQE